MGMISDLAAMVVGTLRDSWGGNSSKDSTIYRIDFVLILSFIIRFTIYFYLLSASISY